MADLHRDVRYGFLTYVTSAAGSGLVRDLLTDEQLASGNGLLSSIDQGLHLLSPLLGAGVYGLFGGAALAVTTSTILVAAALLTVAVRLVEHISTDEREPFWPEITAGVRHIRRVPVLARVTTAMAVALLVTGFSNIAIFAVIDQGLHRSSEFFGVLASIQGGGSVLGGLTAAAVIARVGERGAMAIGLVLLGIALALRCDRQHHGRDHFRSRDRELSSLGYSSPSQRCGSESRHPNCRVAFHPPPTWRSTVHRPSAPRWALR